MSDAIHLLFRLRAPFRPNHSIEALPSAPNTPDRIKPPCQITAHAFFWPKCKRPAVQSAVQRKSRPKSRPAHGPDGTLEGSFGWPQFPLCGKQVPPTSINMCSLIVNPAFWIDHVAESRGGCAVMWGGWLCPPNSRRGSRRGMGRPQIELGERPGAKESTQRA